MEKRLLSLTVAITMAFTGIVAAQKTADKPVTSVIHDADVNFTPYRIQSDLSGAYQNGISSVVSRMQGIGDWELDMLNSPTRRVFVDFSDAVPNSNPSNLAAPPNAYYPVRFLSQCSTRGTNLQNLALNASATCPIVLAVNVGADRYSVRFNATNYPGTNEATWTCTSAASGKCNAWRMRSDPNGTGKLAAQLLKITTSKGKTVETSYGKYYFSFDIGLTNP